MGAAGSYRQASAQERVVLGRVLRAIVAVLLHLEGWLASRSFRSLGEIPGPS